MKTKIISLVLCVGMLFACNNTQKGAGIGAGGGALLGGIIGAIAGNTMIGAAVGGAVGAGAGAIIGKKMDKAKAEAEAIQNAQVEEVTDANGLEAVKMTFDSGILFAFDELYPEKKKRHVESIKEEMRRFRELIRSKMQ